MAQAPLFCVYHNSYPSTHKPTFHETYDAAVKEGLRVISYERDVQVRVKSKDRTLAEGQVHSVKDPKGTVYDYNFTVFQFEGDPTSTTGLIQLLNQVAAKLVE